MCINQKEQTKKALTSSREWEPHAIVPCTDLFNLEKRSTNENSRGSPFVIFLLCFSSLFVRNHSEASNHLLIAAPIPTGKPAVEAVVSPSLYPVFKLIERASAGWQTLCHAEKLKEVKLPDNQAALTNTPS